jgi:MOSC domain-containing protein YiiM
MSCSPIKSSHKQSVGSILKLFSSKESVNRVLLDEKGVYGDKFYGKNINRSVLISTIESYNIANERNIIVEHGALGENILMDYNPYHLPSGAKIKIGEVVLEISQHCTLCKSLTKIDNRLPKLLKDDRGLFAKVIRAGEIKYGDKIYIL